MKTHPRLKPSLLSSRDLSSLFQIKVVEERARYDRLSNEQQRLCRYSPHTQVVKWWKERGDWRDKFDKTMSDTFWKWRHESSEHEEFNSMKSVEDFAAYIPDI
jgi:hypothetical protein